jgi:hypothetical protein
MALSDKDPIRDLADRAVRDSLRFPEHLRGLLSRVVPDLVDSFVFEQMRLLERDFPMEDWRRREADLPLEVPYRVGPTAVPSLVVVLLEHQSDTDPLMPLRLLYFVVTYWDQQWRAWEETPAPKPPFRLNPVLPVVVYTGDTAWGSSRTLAGLLGEPQAFHVYAPAWRPLFWSLAEQAPEDLLASNNAWLQLMAVLRVEGADAATFREVFTRALHQVKKIKGAEQIRWHEVMRILLTWVFWRRPAVERAALVAEAEHAQAGVKRKGEVQDMVSKLGPSMVDLAREEGRKEGEVQALRDMLQSLLHDKFGRLPKKLQKLIETTEDAERLRQAIRHVPQCAALPDFQF